MARRVMRNRFEEIMLKVQPGAHKRREAAPRSVQQRMIAWNSDVLTAAARLWPFWHTVT